MVSQHDFKENLAYGVARKLSTGMGIRQSLERPPRPGTGQPGRHFHQRDEGWGTFSTIAWLFHVSYLFFCSTVTFGHSSLTIYLSAGSPSNGTLGRVVSDFFYTQLLFFGVMFLSFLSDTFSRFLFVKCGSSPAAAPSSYSPLGINLRSDFIRLG